MVKKLHADQKYLIALVNNDTALINQIYKKCAAKVKSLIIFNSGSTSDAEDIFQETLIDIYNQTKYKNLELTCPFEPFFLLLCKRKWLNQLKKRAQLPVTNTDDELLHLSEDTFEQAELFESQLQQEAFFLKAFEKLGPRCKEIITLCLKGDAQEKVADTLGVTYGYLRKKKSECMASLIKIVNA